MRRYRYIIFLFLSILLIFSVYLFVNNSVKTEKLLYTDFIDYLDKDMVQQVKIVNEDILNIKLKDNLDAIYEVPNPLKIDLKEELLLKNVEVVTGNSAILDTIFRFFAIAIFLVYIFWYMRRTNGNKQKIVNVNKTKIKNNNIVKFDNVAGNDEAKDMVQDIIDFIKTPDKYIKMGARMPRGVLLYGPPGTGKTLMAKAVAGEASVPFYAVSGSDFIQMYVGVGASRIRNLFKKAKESEKAVIFIDEIDAIGKKRARNTTSSNDERDQTLNALLTEMSGFNDNDGIVVFAATNRLDTLDEALLRPGRFDRQIEVGLPDYNARKAILELNANNKPVNNNVDFEKLARETVFFSGAMLENLLNEAAINAANNNDSIISNENISKAFYTVVVGAEKKNRSQISIKEKNITAYHEAGHALATKLLLPENTIAKVTIIPSTKGAGGFSMSISKDKNYYSKREIQAKIQILLAGRVAEEIVFGKDEITTGASNDIEKASNLIKDYILRFGMDEEIGMFNSESVNMSNDNAILESCRNEMKQLYQITRELLLNNIELLRSITNKLIEKETLDGDDIEKIFTPIVSNCC